MSKQTVEFKTEVKELLDLVIHSLYSNREIFLRELISNAADAVDRARFESLTKKGILEGDDQWKIKIIRDEKAGTLTVSDNGIGMDEASVTVNIGTIARSGTRAFLEQLKQKGAKDNPEFIGQFGVGFYSAFMVSDRVTVVSRMAGDPKKGVRWASTGDGTYTLEIVEKAKRGTEVTLHLRDDAKDFLNEFTIRSTVKKFSDYVEHPVVMDVEKEKKKVEEETLNSRKAIWLKPKSEITDKEYNEFYQHISRDFTDPLRIIHYAAEGASEFKALLYFPSKAPFTLFDNEHKIGIHLYVKRVFIMDDCKKLLPEYLRFAKGVVDSSDLPLNVSREILQENKEVERIRKNLVNRILSELKTMKDKEIEKYKTFYREFGKVVKEGIHYDHGNKEKLSDLLLYQSTQTEADVPVTLEQYTGRMREGQNEIYYIIGEDMAGLKASPYLEKFRHKGYEVLFMDEPIDEWVVQSLTEYKGKKLKAVNKGEVDIDEKEEKKARKAAEKQYKDLVEFLKKQIPDVQDVRLSTRLTDSACCLVAHEHAMGAHMEKMFKAMGQGMPSQKPILEINPGHAFVKNMEALFKKDGKHPKLSDYATFLYDQALLMEGQKIKDPVGFAKKLNEYLAQEASGLAGG
jgi:molecular chaperone HtpG